MLILELTNLEKLIFDSFYFVFNHFIFNLFTNVFSSPKQNLYIKLSVILNPLFNISNLTSLPVHLICKTQAITSIYSIYINIALYPPIARRSDYLSRLIKWRFYKKGIAKFYGASIKRHCLIKVKCCTVYLSITWLNCRRLISPFLQS